MHSAGKLALTVAVLAIVASGCRDSGGSSGHKKRAGGGNGGTGAAGAGTGSGTGTGTGTGYAATATEWIEVEVEDEMTAVEIAGLLDRTVGLAASTGTNPVVGLPLREGVYMTAVPRGANVLLRFEVDTAASPGSGTGVPSGARETIAEVPLSAASGRTFVELVSVAMATMALTSQTPGLASPWELILCAESESGGEVVIRVGADAAARFMLCWEVESPARAIDAFLPPAAFGPNGDEPGMELIGGTVHFPITVQQFQHFVAQAYGAYTPQRFTDFALIPHTWLHLTITGDAQNRVVNVHFDAITTSGARIFVAEAPASTAVGGRFFDETVMRMQDMLAAEARQPGSSRKWGTSFYYASDPLGLVEVVVEGEHGLFDIAYRVETPESEVRP